MSIDTTKLSALVGRAVTDQERTRLVEALKAGNANEELARLLGVQARAEDPPTAQATATPAPAVQTTQQADAPAELTDQEAERIASKLTPHLQALIKQEMQSYQQGADQAATKAAEPQTAKLDKIEQTITALKASFDQLTGQQSAGERYRASQAADTIITRAADPNQQQPQPTIVQSMTDHILSTRSQQGGQ